MIQASVVMYPTYGIRTTTSVQDSLLGNLKKVCESPESFASFSESERNRIQNLVSAVDQAYCKIAHFDHSEGIAIVVCENDGCKITFKQTPLTATMKLATNIAIGSKSVVVLEPIKNLIAIFKNPSGFGELQLMDIDHLGTDHAHAGTLPFMQNAERQIERHRNLKTVEQAMQSLNQSAVAPGPGFADGDGEMEQEHVSGTSSFMQSPALTESDLPSAMQQTSSVEKPLMSRENFYKKLQSFKTDANLRAIFTLYGSQLRNFGQFVHGHDQDFYGLIVNEPDSGSHTNLTITSWVHSDDQNQREKVEFLSFFIGQFKPVDFGKFLPVIDSNASLINANKMLEWDYVRVLRSHIAEKLPTNGMPPTNDNIYAMLKAHILIVQKCPKSAGRYVTYLKSFETWLNSHKQKSDYLLYFTLVKDFNNKNPCENELLKQYLLSKKASQENQFSVGVRVAASILNIEYFEKPWIDELYWPPAVR